MVNSVSSTPYYSYLSQLQNTAQNPAAAPTTPATTTDTDAQSASSSLVSSLLGKGSYSTSVLSLLQQDSSGNFDPISTIFGGSSTNNGLAKLYANLYNSSAASSLQLSKLNNPKEIAPVASQDFLATAVQTSLAYNQTIQQNAANAVAAAKAKTDSVTSLIS